VDEVDDIALALPPEVLLLLQINKTKKNQNVIVKSSSKIKRTNNNIRTFILNLPISHVDAVVIACKLITTSFQ
jgi:hypothetical protein